MVRARCNARLTPGWLSSSRDAAAVMLFSSDAANVIRRFKSTCRSFSKHMMTMTRSNSTLLTVISMVPAATYYA